MTYWLLATIFAYLFFGVTSLCDKLVLGNKDQKSLKPNAYAFYVSIFGLSSILIIPFINFGFPSLVALFWIILDAIVHIVAIYAMYVALQKFEVSKVIPTIGATQSIFIFILTPLFWPAQTMLPIDILAFVLLLLGSIVISVEKNIKITADFLKITLFSALMFALDYICLKFIFSSQPFLHGVVWIMLFLFLFSLVFLIKKSSRKEIFEKQTVSDKKNQLLFLGAQVAGGAGNLLQSFAIYLAPVAFLAIVNSLKGIQYVFLFIVAFFISYFYPKILKEQLSKKIVIQKLVSIVFIVAGLAILVAK